MILGRFVYLASFFASLSIFSLLRVTAYVNGKWGNVFAVDLQPPIYNKYIFLSSL